MIVRPFAALRSTSENAQMLSCVPYDVIDTAEARQLAHGNPLSWLHVIRAEIDLPAGTDEHAPAVYTKAAENLTSFRKREWIVDESGPALYVYRMTMGDHVQTGILACCSVGEYDNGIIKKHELTRKDKEDDRTRYIVTTQMQTEPVLLTYRDQPGLEPLMEAVIRRPATLKSTSETGVVHEIWRIEAPQPFVDFFTRIPVAYIADGHHRSASASRARTECRASAAESWPRESASAVLRPLSARSCRNT